MVYVGKVEGIFVNLRSVRVEDANFILTLRNNRIISKYLPPLNVTTEQQQSWIKEQRVDNNSFYFIIEDRFLKTDIGTISIYNIEGNHSECGRFCSLGNFIQNSEAAILLGDFIFENLNLDYLDIWVYKDNKLGRAYDEFLGCVWEGEKIDKRCKPYLYGKLFRENYEIMSKEIKRKIKNLSEHNI